MTTIKNFIYLDDYKMYSMSSQLFGGVDHSKSSYEDVTKGASQNIEGLEHSDLHEENPIIEHGFGHVAHKHVHDYAYIDFENRLRKDGKIIGLSAENFDPAVIQLSGDKFIEIRGKVVFVDMNAIKFTIENFSELSNAITELSISPMIDAINKQAEVELQSASNSNERSQIKRKTKNLIDEVRKNFSNLGLDEDLIGNLGAVLEFGFRDQFMIQMTAGNHIFSAECKPDNLREDRHLLIRKFSRIPEKEFVIVGTISQSLNHIINPIDNDEMSEIQEQPDIKTAIMSMVQRLSELEDKFTGRRANEIIIDPIAVYWEI